MTPMGLIVSRLVVVGLIPGLLLGASCNRSLFAPVPLEQALDAYFNGGYVAYALPGRGPNYEPGAIITYRKRAELTVRSRSDCFPLGTVPGVGFAPKAKWTTHTELGAALQAVIPQAAAAKIAADLSASNVRSAQLEFDELVTRQIPLAAVREWRLSKDFPGKCVEDYVASNILVLGTIGAKTLKYQLADERAVGVVLEAMTKLDIGGKITARRSSSASNVLDIESNEITWIGYLPYQLSAPASRDTRIDQLREAELPVSNAIKLKRSATD